MSKNCVNHKKSFCNCQNCCLATVLMFFLFSLIIYLIVEQIVENTIFLKTNNISLVKTFHCRFWNRGDLIQNDPRIASFVEKDNKTAVIFGGFYRSLPKEIILKDSDDFFVLADHTFYGGINFNPKKIFRRESSFSFYRIQKETKDGKPQVAQTVFLGSIETNLYGEWKKPYYLSLSHNGKYIVMSAYAVDSRSHGEFRNKDVLLVWEIGDNVVEKDIVDSTGKKIPILIKTEEELERR